MSSRVHFGGSSKSTRLEFYNNIVSNAPNPYDKSGTLAINSSNKLFDTNFANRPVGIVGNPMYVADPTNNDYYTLPGSPARDTGYVLSPSVGDPAIYCNDQTPLDIGFLESCN